MKRLVTLMCAAAIILSMTACSQNTVSSAAESSAAESSTSTSAYASTTVAGEVTAVDGSTVTVQLGELTENENNGGTPPEMPAHRPKSRTATAAQTARPHRMLPAARTAALQTATRRRRCRAVRTETRLRVCRAAPPRPLRQAMKHSTSTFPMRLS